jgi:hypothetical protein
MPVSSLDERWHKDAHFANIPCWESDMLHQGVMVSRD